MAATQNMGIKSKNKLTKDDGNFIAFSRVEPQKNNMPEVLFLSGFRSDMQGTKALYLDEYCKTQGLGYTRFDYYGHGVSSGEFEDGTIGRWLEDALCVIDKLAQGPVILVGSSLGGWLMTLTALKRPERIKGLVGIAAAPDFTEELMWASLSPAQRDELETCGIIQRASQYEEGRYNISMNLIEEARSHLVLRQKLDITCPVHLLHGTADIDVPHKFATRLMDAIASDNVKITLVKNGDHRLSNPAELELLSRTIESML